MKSILTKLSKDILLEKLEIDLECQQRKYDYHKKISEGYHDLIEQTKQKISEVEGNVN